LEEPVSDISNPLFGSSIALVAPHDFAGYVRAGLRRFDSEQQFGALSSNKFPLVVIV
jgi:hypothetical protein